MADEAALLPLAEVVLRHLVVVLHHLVAGEDLVASVAAILAAGEAAGEAVAADRHDLTCRHTCFFGIQRISE